jgi:hypothetical protein
MTVVSSQRLPKELATQLDRFTYATAVSYLMAALARLSVSTLPVVLGYAATTTLGTYLEIAIPPPPTPGALEDRVYFRHSPLAHPCLLVHAAHSVHFGPAWVLTTGWRSRDLPQSRHFGGGRLTSGALPLPLRWGSGSSSQRPAFNQVAG